MVVVVSNTDMMQDKKMPEYINELLQESACTRMRRLLRMQGNEGWIREVIHDGTLMAVTHGSYIQERFPNLCSTAFILECSSD